MALAIRVDYLLETGARTESGAGKCRQKRQEACLCDRADIRSVKRVIDSVPDRQQMSGARVEYSAE